MRRVFYAVEEPLELHLAILEGVQARYETPFFDNLKKYAQRPIGTFHALPIARGKSIFKSDWIRDMGEFYGPTLFLAESSATTGGLDSLLEPTGNIKTSAGASGACLRGGSRVLCDQRHVHAQQDGGAGPAGARRYRDHRPQLSQIAPLWDGHCRRAAALCRGVPDDGILDVWRRAAAHDQAGAARSKAEGQLDRVKLLDLTNCTFDGHIYNTRRVMEECLAIKPDLIFLWDEAWFGFARWSPFLGLAPRWARRPTSKHGCAIPKALKHTRRSGQNWATIHPTTALLDTRLIPDPAKVRLRVYQTNSTHKSMSALRQGSMVLVKDVDYHKVEEQFHEAVFTHASTSPNQQLIASLDVARRQMELEGFGLVIERDRDCAGDPPRSEPPSADLQVFPRSWSR